MKKCLLFLLSFVRFFSFLSFVIFCSKREVMSTQYVIHKKKHGINKKQNIISPVALCISTANLTYHFHLTYQLNPFLKQLPVIELRYFTCDIPPNQKKFFFFSLLLSSHKATAKTDKAK